MKYEDITSAHIRAWGLPTFEDDDLICGFAGYSSAGKMACLCVAWPDVDRWWVGFARNEHCSRTVYRQFLNALDALASVEFEGVQQIPEVWATCDESQPRARELMEHLGFEPVTATDWKLDLRGRARRH